MVLACGIFFIIITVPVILVLGWETPHASQPKITLFRGLVLRYSRPIWILIPIKKNC